MKYLSKCNLMWAYPPSWVKIKLFARALNFYLFIELLVCCYFQTLVRVIIYPPLCLYMIVCTARETPIPQSATSNVPLPLLQTAQSKYSTSSRTCCRWHADRSIGWQRKIGNLDPDWSWISFFVGRKPEAGWHIYSRKSLRQKRSIMILDWPSHVPKRLSRPTDIVE